MRVQRSLRPVTIALAGLVLLGLLGACGDSSTTEESTSGETMTMTPSASPTDDCADVTALQESLTALTDVDPLADGTDALNAAIEDVKSDLDAALDSASAELQPQIDDVETAFTSLQDAVTGLTADNLTEKAPEIKSALTDLGTATMALGTSITDNCVTS
jgi:hypothetical protein